LFGIFIFAIYYLPAKLEIIFETTKKVEKKLFAPFSKREIKNPLALMVGVRGLLVVVIHCSG